MIPQEKNKRIFINGPIKDLTTRSASGAFAEAKQFLLSEGFDEVINPFELIRSDFAVSETIISLLNYLASCNYIAMLPGWEKCPRSLYLYNYAVQLEKENKIHAIIHIVHSFVPAECVN